VPVVVELLLFSRLRRETAARTEEDRKMTKKVTKIDVKQDKTAPVPTRTEAWAPFNSLRDEIDRLFDDFGTGFWRHPFPQRIQGMFPTTGGALVTPAIEVVERDGDFNVTAELPGMKPEDVEVKVAEGTITIRGEKSEEMKEEKDDYLLSERRYGEFQRVLPLPTGIDTDRVVATFVNGILTVTLPKTAEAKQKERKIEVKAA
jgi:HSP20 family protein